MRETLIFLGKLISKFLDFTTKNEPVKTCVSLINMLYIGETQFRNTEVAPSETGGDELLDFGKVGKNFYATQSKNLEKSSNPADGSVGSFLCILYKTIHSSVQ